MTQTFRALGVSDAVCNVLSKRGIETPFEIQDMVIPEAIRGGDVLAKSPTGSGKTLAFAIPIVQGLDVKGPTPAALILVPTRELASQVTEEIELVGKPLGIRVSSVYGGVPLKSQADQARKAHVVVATPGRLQDLVDRKLLSIDSVSVLVLDEADRMLDMGFKPQVDKIVRRLPENRQTMFFSATLDGEVGEVARRYTSSPARSSTSRPASSPHRWSRTFVRTPTRKASRSQRSTAARRSGRRPTARSMRTSWSQRPAGSST